MSKVFVRITLTAIFITSTAFTISDPVRIEFVRSKVEHFARIVYYSADRQLASAFYHNFDSFRIAVPFHKQEHSVTCEAAALRQALNFLGTNVTEDELLRALAFSTRQPMNSDGTWGDPDEGFVGNINGSIFNNTGYGVYEKPILELASKYKNAQILANATLYDLNKEIIKGNPVVVWGILTSRYPKFWKTRDGKMVKAYPGLHVRTLMGFEGDIRNPDKVILMDPKYGEIRMSAKKFIEDWELLDRRAVVVYQE